MYEVIAILLRCILVCIPTFVQLGMFELSITIAVLTGILISDTIFLLSRTNSSHRDHARLNPKKTNAPGNSPTSTTDSNQRRHGRDQEALLFLGYISVLLALITFLLRSHLLDISFWIAKSTLHLALDNVYHFMVSSIVLCIICECCLQAKERLRRNVKSSAASESKTVQDFPLKAREIRGHASKNTIIADEGNARQEFLAKAQDLSEKMNHELPVLAAESPKDPSVKSAMLSPAVVAEAILRMDAHAWREIEPVLAIHFQNVVKNEDGWEWV